MNNLIVNSIKNEIVEWNNFIEIFFNKKQKNIVKWGLNSRTYKDDNYHYKFQKKNTTIFNKSLKYEFKILKKNKRIYNDFHPKYYNYPFCEVLRIKTIKGKDLENLDDFKPINKLKIIFKLIILLFNISLSGIFYKQLRLRHIFINKNNKLFFIDFGNSLISKKIFAIYSNFKPIIYEKKFIPNKYISVIIIILKSLFAKEKNYNYHSRFQINFNQSFILQLNIIKGSNLDNETIKKIQDLRNYYNEIYIKYPKAVIDSFEFRFLGFGFAGNRNIHLLLEQIISFCSIENSTIFDFNTYFGVSSVFYSIYNANKVYNFEDDKNLIETKIKLNSIFSLNNIIITKNADLNKKILIHAKQRKILSYLSLENIQNNKYLISSIDLFDAIIIFSKDNKILIELINKYFNKIIIRDSFFKDYKIIYATK